MKWKAYSGLLNTHSPTTQVTHFSRWKHSEQVGHSWPKPCGLPSWPLDIWHLPKAYDPARAEIDKADV